MAGDTAAGHATEALESAAVGGLGSSALPRLQCRCRTRTRRNRASDVLVCREARTAFEPLKLRGRRPPALPLAAQTRHSGGSGPDAREMTEGGLCARALGARVGRQADELGALFPETPGEVVVLGLVAGGNHLLVFDVFPGEGSGVV